MNALIYYNSIQCDLQDISDTHTDTYNKINSQLQEYTQYVLQLEERLNGESKINRVNQGQLKSMDIDSYFDEPSKKGKKK